MVTSILYVLLFFLSDEFRTSRTFFSVEQFRDYERVLAWFSNRRIGQLMWPRIVATPRS
jgi:hypothetical protein